MTAEEYLEQVKKLDAIIINKMRDYRRWASVAEGLGGFSVGERVKSSRNLSQSSDAIGKYIDIEREIEALKQERQAIIETIQRLPLVEYDILYKLYVEEKELTLKEIAYEYSKSYEWAKARKKKALRHVQIMIDERNKE